MSLLRLRADAARIPLADGSAHCIVTSPPYANLRVYADVPPTVWGGDSSHAHEWGESATCACESWRGTLGNEPRVDCLGWARGEPPCPACYVCHLRVCFAEVKRVLRNDGVCWIVLGDSFHAGGRNGHGTRIGYKQQTNRASAAGADNARASPEGIADGNMLGVPWRVALALQADGWILRSMIVWAKGLSLCPSYSGAVMPESLGSPRWERHRIRVGSATVKRDGKNGSGQRSPRWRDCDGCQTCAPNDGFVLRRGSWRPSSAHEHVLMLAKTLGYYADGEAVKERAVSTHGSGNGYRREARESYADADGPRGSDETWKPGPGALRNLRNVWAVPTQVYRGAHFAAFPEALVEPMILSSTSARGVCAVCSAPYARVVERHRTLDGLPADLPPMRSTDIAEPSSAQGIGHGRTGSASRTLDWRQTCACRDAGDPVPAVVLDPFAGSGVTGRVAVRHRRRAILCDLSRTYLRDLAAARTSEVQTELPL